MSGIFEKLIAGDRVALGQAMTLVESALPEDREVAMKLLSDCEARLSLHDPSTRITISGAPGAGKSTFIEALGLKAITQGYKVGVITIDPTSSLSQGSILGDKSRMNRLSVAPAAFIRSTAAGNVLGGLSRRSMEIMTLLSAAGYNLIFLETVGVGQSEHLTWQFTDGFLLLIQPGGGDELQGIKRGITEMADVIIINKADGNFSNLAKIAKSQYENALHFFSSTREGWVPKILTCSAIEGHGIDDVWALLRLYMEYLDQRNLRKEDRARQKTKWLDWSLALTAQELLLLHPLIRQQIDSGKHDVLMNPGSAFTIEYEIENLMRDFIQQPD